MSIQLDTMPKLGFGLMRLPEKEGKIDIEHVCHIDCVTTWGVADDRTWLDGFGMNRNLPKIKQHPLLFDENRQAKPCVRKLLDAVKE